MTWWLRGCRGSYIAQWVEREPLDQTDLDEGWRWILGGGGGILQKLMEKSPRGPGGMVVGPASPTWQLLVLPFVPMPSGVFYSLLVYPSSWSSFVLFLNWVPLPTFSGIILQKTEIHQNSWNLLVWTLDLCIFLYFNHFSYVFIYKMLTLSTVNKLPQAYPLLVP
jgi:hypothetical protein